jgi:phosphoglucosamine mutase
MTPPPKKAERPLSQNAPAPVAAPSARSRRLFGTDGVRGVANAELSPELALSLGAAAAVVLRERAGAEHGEIVVGRDPRLSGDLLEAALVAGLLSQGVNVLSLGVIPTPGVAHAARTRGALAGVVISASHNPMQDNGIKFFGPDGKKLPDAVEADIEAAMEGGAGRTRPSGSGVGRLTRDDSQAHEYAAHLRETAGGVRLEGMRLVIDAANGAASFLAAEVFEGLGATVELLSATPDGVNINDGCGSLHPETMAARVAASGADAGLAFDGDADRVILADGAGRVFDGDRVLCAAGVHLAKQGRLPSNVVVGTVMSNLGLEEALGRHGITLVRAAVGDRYVAEQMAKHGAALGGEKSGHILFPEHSPAGDGMLTAIQVLRLCRESGRSLAEWAGEMREFPQKLVNVRVRKKDGWERVAAIQDAIRSAESELGTTGRINVRPSGTEKLIRVMVEAPDEATVERLTGSVAAVIREHLGA